MKNPQKDPFEEYLREAEPERRERGYAWHTAIGLQAVDGLMPSDYLKETARKNIEGDISLDQAQTLIETYYQENPEVGEDRTKEADLVSVRIAMLLSENAFVFSSAQYLSIHRRLFEGIYAHAGKIRDYNITKKEWVLDGDTVIYGGATELRATLEDDLSQEKAYSYKWLTMTEVIRHLAGFISRLWQIHVFGEGNTRTTAVFFIQYLRTLGFAVTNDIFANHAWYFRNAMVRANYNNLKLGVHETTEYLELFLRNLLLGEDHEMHNRVMHISGSFSPVSEQDDPINDPINDPIKLLDRERALLRQLRRSPSLTRRELAEIMQCSESTIKRMLQNLAESKLITRIGSRKTGEWVINDSKNIRL